MMTDNEIKQRLLAVELLYHMFKKYYPQWLCETVNNGREENKEDLSANSNEI